MYWIGSNPLTSQANRTPWRAASNLVIGAAPDRPARRPAQDSATVLPTGVTSPRPVTTTRRTRLFPDFLVEILESVAYGAQLLRFFVRDVDVEFLLESHDQLDGVEAVRAEILHETGLGSQLLPFDAQLLDDDVLDPIFHVAHGVL